MSVNDLRDDVSYIVCLFFQQGQEKIRKKREEKNYTLFIYICL